LRRWLWPYAILAALLSLAGIGALSVMVLGSGAERAAANLSMANVVIVEPGKRFLVSMLEMIAPFDLPNWVKDVYAILALVAIVGLFLSAVMGMLLLPVFYALYRGAHRDD
jgi:integral membrane sensor domain MASE1